MSPNFGSGNFGKFSPQPHTYFIMHTVLCQKKTRHKELSFYDVFRTSYTAILVPDNVKKRKKIERGLGGRIDSMKCPPEKWGRERGENGERERGKQRGKKRCEKKSSYINAVSNN